MFLGRIVKIHKFLMLLVENIQKFFFLPFGFAQVNVIIDRIHFLRFERWQKVIFIRTFFTIYVSRVVS